MLDEPQLEHPFLSGIFADEKGDIRNVTALYTTKQCPCVEFVFSGRSRFFGFEVEITGTEGRICIGNGFARIYRRKSSKLYTGFYSLAADSVHFPRKTGYFANMVQNAVDFLDGTAPVLSTLEHGICALRVLEDIKNALNC